MVRRILPYIRQYETHRQLAGRARPGSWRVGRTDLDAIIVPASRTADNLEHAVELARAAQCWLIVLCSRETRATEVAQLFTDRGFGTYQMITVIPCSPSAHQTWCVAANRPSA